MMMIDKWYDNDDDDKYDLILSSKMSFNTFPRKFSRYNVYQLYVIFQLF